MKFDHLKMLGYLVVIVVVVVVVVVLVVVKNLFLH